MIQFPKNFLWGAATAAYQVEGGNAHADWWRWEKEAGKENSGEACRHYDLYLCFSYSPSPALSSFASQALLVSS